MGIEETYQRGLRAMESWYERYGECDKVEKVHLLYEPDRRCEYCGMRMPAAARGNAKYCSVKCRHRARKEYNREYCARLDVKMRRSKYYKERWRKLALRSKKLGKTLRDVPLEGIQAPDVDRNTERSDVRRIPGDDGRAGRASDVRCVSGDTACCTAVQTARCADKVRRNTAHGGDYLAQNTSTTNCNTEDA